VCLSIFSYIARTASADVQSRRLNYRFPELPRGSFVCGVPWLSSAWFGGWVCCLVVALIDGQHASKRLPVIRKALTCYKLLEVLLKEIECCPGLMTSQRLPDGQRCTHCSRTATSAGKGQLYITHTHTHLTALFWDYLGEPVPERQNQSRFY